MKVLIVDDHPVARRGLRMIVSEAFSGAECTDAPDPAAALALSASVCPELVLLDMHMPGDIPVQVLCGRLRENLPAATIIIVTAFDSSAEIRACLLAGADGCLLKDTSETDMAAALRTAVAGGPAIDSRVAFELARSMAREQTAQAARPHLSGREADVLRLLAEGRSNRAIAERLNLSEATVKGHVSRLLDKLDASSRLEAVVRASDVGLI